MTPQSARRLITLVRHGQSTWNHLGLIQGQNDQAVLTPRGRDEARAAGRALESRNCEDLVTSDLRRTLETAAIIADGLALSPDIDARLRERCFGVLEGQPIPQLTPELSGIREGVLVDPDAKPEGGESFRDVVERVGSFFEDAQARDTHLVVVTHGGAIRALRAYVEGSALDGLAMIEVPNCSIWTLEPA